MPDLREMLQKLTDHYAKSPQSNIGKLLSIVHGQLNDLDQTLETMQLWRDIDLARGSTLDNIGQNVAQPRGMASDEVYRVLIKSKIARNLSRGDINTLIRVIAISVNANYSEIEIREKYTDPSDPEPAAISLVRLPFSRISDSEIDVRQFTRILQKTIPAGVRVDAVELQGTFSLASGDGPEMDIEAGFANTDQTSGGTLGAVFTPAENIDLPI
ncbi:hypothetical protein [Paenibacillus radicis (ex Xue et al. 2023)]|uniref:DUF2612 domain-containing protein n=1 Tax=Paenibacillus radicis (ex Xue et al. 2023) TaxID=2972489 RepID=A0ABT1YT56_9BACL|nr:hypothetical protein [Paenibacillus radicis (ex Xue et al. 2023)]MCR8636192.1 hypothetical protein [Paenibacillus radicis (ex Xue et al. 2023)]